MKKKFKIYLTSSEYMSLQKLQDADVAIVDGLIYKTRVSHLGHGEFPTNARMALERSEVPF